ncbi:MAG TPA: lipase maturation factor family protein, partial [Polyangiaceae bacterium]|nr:lipase maturation factor family protein [Polyangiaceae bacterium]
MPTTRQWLSRAFFLRGLGLVYAAAFLSLARQSRGLFGDRGILPIAGFLSGQRETLGLSAMLHSPSLFWVDASDGALVAVAGVGLLAGLVLAAGCSSALATFAAWLCYLSFVSAGQVFTAQPCDLLLLEAGFLAIFSSPSLRWEPRFAPPPIVVFLFRWLLFRALFGAGLARLRSDACWGSLTCLPDYLETQPGPTPIAFLLHAWPLPVHRALTFVALFAEVAVPFGLFGPRRLRHAAAAFVLTVSVLSILVTNDGFSSWLTVVLSLWCFDDAVFEKVPLFNAHAPNGVDELGRRASFSILALAAALFGSSLLELPKMLAPKPDVEASLEPFHLVNTYGVVEEVERERREVVFEGTWDDVAAGPAQWLAYELPCKPGEPSRAPCLPSPYLRRLDSRLWRAGLGDFRREPWVVRVVDDLLRENQAVTGLFAQDPFAGKPPRFV